MTRWLTAFALTQLVEVPVYWRALRGRSRATAFGIAFGASVLTHPLVWLGNPLVPGGWWTYFAVAESFAVLAEALWLRLFGVRRAIAWSLLANGLSAGIGLAARQIAESL